MDIQKTVYQHATLGSLMAGVMEGSALIDDILQHGDLGIGTLEGSDGEVIFIDNQAYVATANSQIQKLTGKESTPYSVITNFLPDQEFILNKTMTKDDIELFIKNNMKSPNLFSAIKLTGTFKKIHVRISPKREKPYPRFVAGTAVQPEYTKENISGSIIGFFTPELFHGVGVAGFHLHFIDENRQFGGHILDYQLASGHLELSAIETMEQHFPTENKAFMQTQIESENLANEILKSES